MVQAAKTRLEIDAAPAKASMRSLLREADATSKKVTSKVRGAVGKGLGAVGLGGALGVGLASVRAATTSGVGDVLGEALGGIGARAADFVFSDMNEDARGTKTAREETIAAFGAIAGQQGAIPPEARNYFQQIRSLRVQEERGRELFEKDDRFRGPGVDDLLRKFLGPIGEMLVGAADHLADRIRPVK